MSWQKRQEFVNLQDDLVNIPSLNQDSISIKLKDRWSSGSTYTRVGSDILVSVNPFKDLPSSSNETCKLYAANFKNSNPDKERLPPHVFDLVDSAYFHMMRNGEDQSLILT